VQAKSLIAELQDKYWLPGFLCWRPHGCVCPQVWLKMCVPNSCQACRSLPSRWVILIWSFDMSKVVYISYISREFHPSFDFVFL
jgi:hypothetical protein